MYFFLFAVWLIRDCVIFQGQNLLLMYSEEYLLIILFKKEKYFTLK